MKSVRPNLLQSFSVLFVHALKSVFGGLVSEQVPQPRSGREHDKVEFFVLLTLAFALPTVRSAAHAAVDRRTAKI